MLARLSNFPLPPLAGAHCPCAARARPQVKQCVAKLASMSVQQIEDEYGFPDSHTAEALRSRSIGGVGTSGHPWGRPIGHPPPHRSLPADNAQPQPLAIVLGGLLLRQAGLAPTLP